MGRKSKFIAYCNSYYQNSNSFNLKKKNFFVVITDKLSLGKLFASSIPLGEITIDFWPLGSVNNYAEFPRTSPIAMEVMSGDKREKPLLPWPWLQRTFASTDLCGSGKQLISVCHTFLAEPKIAVFCENSFYNEIACGRTIFQPHWVNVPLRVYFEVFTLVIPPPSTYRCRRGRISTLVQHLCYLTMAIQESIELENVGIEKTMRRI